MSKKPYLKKLYEDKGIAELKQSLKLSNVHEVPKIEKIVLNSGITADADKNLIAEIKKEMASIAGQQPIYTKARKSISNFKLRKGVTNGAKTTLRGNKMYEFLYRLIGIALPSVRDFRGVSKKLDGRGNYNLGIVDTSIFPEILIDSNRKPIGMDVTIVTTARNDEEGRSLLSFLGMPFRK